MGTLAALQRLIPAYGWKGVDSQLSVPKKAVEDVEIAATHLVRKLQVIDQNIILLQEKVKKFSKGSLNKEKVALHINRVEYDIQKLRESLSLLDRVEAKNLNQAL